ncbi:hypothetical protein JCM31826_10380 [Thermaurantimonas aggregans]|uniref:Uncharacterized protein n=1 Tax=Thermaurantimonas aggregans TaxID=2173829 RepID=A0A401XKJ9_9FLAO|nr:tetratricopeptide repeat protein [Thermaurantimonas aggregans]MCX8147893.1 tetratricopeptide repeat protein [Thermaurantimonas aggregans]GCD77556.1 hypothetical protein JCM31826_10380 [Thermaurantimonas aggregans]
MGSKKLIFIFILTFFFKYGQSQITFNIKEIDRVTYELYTQKNWNSLIDIGKESLRKNISFYYLHVRMGIAYFNKNNFHKAIYHFDQALKISDEEEYVKEYLYWSYLYSGRSSEAEWFSKKLSKTFKENYELNDEIAIKNIDIAYNFTQGNSIEKITHSINKIQNNLNGYLFSPLQIESFYIGLLTKLTSRLRIYQAYTNLNSNQFLYFQASNQNYSNANFNTRLNQYYINTNILVSKSVSLTGGIHFVHSSAKYTTQLTVDSNEIPLLLEVPTHSNVLDIIGFISFYKKFTYFTFGTSYYKAGLNNAKQEQIDFKLHIFPFGNLNLYIVSNFSVQQQDYGLSTIRKNLIIDENIGFKISNNFWAEIYGSVGDMSNFIVKEGMVIYNRSDVINNRLGAKLIFVPNPKWSLTIDYTRLSCTSNFIEYPQQRETNDKFTYLHHSITGILSIKL